MKLVRFRNRIQQFLRAGEEFLFPAVCHTCDTGLYSESEPNFCDTCLSQLIKFESNRCEICSAVIGPNLRTDAGCYYCKDDNFSFERVTTLGTYESLLKEAILLGKVGHDAVILQSLSKLLLESFSDRIHSAKANLILPIPHHWHDRLFQGSQASSTISNYLGGLLNVPCAQQILRKVKRTAKQHSLTPAERRKNLKSAFKTSKKVNLSGARIILVDDVITTGTTCQRATRELRQAGAETIHVFALARGIGA